MRTTRPAAVAAATIALCTAVTVLPGAPAVGRQAGATPGGPTAGDSLFPHAGNSGYRVGHYDLDLSYAPATDVLRGRATVQLRPTKPLSSLTLDLHKLQVTDVRVGADPATWSRNRNELRIEPATSLVRGQRYAVRIDYRGRPGTIRDPDGSSEGWFRTDDGAISVNEPVGAMTWFPVNNTPRDKATYRVSISVPRGLTGVSNGELVRRSTGARRTTWVWRTRDQLASYLTTVAIGRFDRTRGTALDGTPLDSYVDPRLGDAAVARLPEVMRFLTRRFGAYPFDSSGLITDRASIGYALEVQNRPVFTANPGMLLLVHEIAHQWYGNSVTLRDWSDIWLNEGFATYAEWLWEARTRPGAPQRHFEELCAEGEGSPLWHPPPADPGHPANLFGRPVYDRGAMALQALRQRVGPQAFSRVLRSWAAEYAQGNGSTAELKRLAEAESGRQLDRLFRVWLYESGRPAACS